MLEIQPNRVLIVDDASEIREILRIALFDAGFEAAEAENGAVALEKIGQEKFCLILLDMNMPVMNGWQFAELYRAREHKPLPIIVITAAVHASEYAHQINAAGFLAKPFDLDDVESIVKKHYQLES